MKPGLGELAAKGSSSRLKIFSKKSAIIGDSPSKHQELPMSPNSKNQKTFRINQSKQSSLTKLNDSKLHTDQRKTSRHTEVLDQHISLASIHMNEFYSDRRQSGIQNYLIANSSRR